MSDIEIDETGLRIKAQSEMLETAKAAFRSAFGDLARVDVSDSPEGQIARILAEMKNGLASHFQAAVSALLPSKTSGQVENELVKFNGIERNEQVYSTVVVSCTANVAGSTIPAGSIVATPAGARFKTNVELVLSTGETDTVTCTAIEPGPVTALAGAVTEIITPAFGWASVTNAAAAIPGRQVETDPALRARRWEAAVGVGLHHPSKIKAALRNLDDVTAVYVENNRGNVTNAHGVPPHTVRAIVRGGDSATIAAVLFGSYAPYQGAGSVGAGIGTWGNTTVHVVDTVENQEDDINFDRPSDVNVYIRVVTTRIPGQYPANGDALQKQFIGELFAGDLEIEGGLVDALTLGSGVYGTDIMAACRAVTGHKISAVYVGRTPNPTNAVLLLDVDEFPVTSADLITITSP